jgi:DNA-binding MarR family transcriptional regulator
MCQRRGPLGIVELAELAGRDYTTVSREVAKLESLGLVARCPSPEDGRVRAAIVTDEGRAMTQALDAARQKIIEGLFADWETRDVRELSRALAQVRRRCAWVGQVTVGAPEARAGPCAPSVPEFISRFVPLLYRSTSIDCVKTLRHRSLPCHSIS